MLTVPGKQLPKWGYEQQEVSCNPTTRDTNAVWNVEDNLYPKRKANIIIIHEHKTFLSTSLILNPIVENVSFHNFAPGFVSRFLESHAVMLTGNAGLKPKEGEYTSRPWEWPINLRVKYNSGAC